MTKFLTVTSLMLFWAFFEMSGGTEFTPKSAQAEAEVETAEIFTFADTYRPFRQPVITGGAPDTRLSKSDGEGEMAIMQASYTDAGTLDTTVTGEAAVIRTVAPAAAAPAQERLDIRNIAGDRVNVRMGPGTDYGVIGTFPQGTETLVLQVNDSDWAEIELLGTGERGWVAAWLLSD